MEPASHTTVAEAIGGESLLIRGVGAPRIRFSIWVPYALAACLMVIVALQARHIQAVKTQLTAANRDVDRLTRSQALVDLRVTTLDVRDATYALAKILVAWDPYQYRGVLSLQNLPMPQTGRDYQLWVLDPEAERPISAGTIKADAGSARFQVKPLTTPNPGFAITLEPAGGSPAPTSPVLFAVAPGP